MANWRKLHTKILDSRDFNTLPGDFDRLAWVLMPLVLDREGRGIDDAAWLKSKLFPVRRDVSYEQIDATMTALAERGMIQRYAADGQAYFQIPTWSKYQKVHPNETESHIPPISDGTPMVNQRCANSTPKVALDKDGDKDKDGDGDGEKAADAAPAGNPPPAPEEQKAEAHHPALVVYRDVYDKWPSKAVWETIISTVGDAPASLKLYCDVLKAWALRNYSPVNFEGQLDWFKAGGKPARQPSRGRQNGRATVADAFDLVDQIAAERAAMGGAN